MVQHFFVSIRMFFIFTVRLQYLQLVDTIKKIMRNMIATTTTLRIVTTV